MSLAVVDASVLTAYYSTDDPRRPRTVARLSTGDTLFAPAHLDAKIVSALRGLVRSNPKLLPAVAPALSHLAGSPIRRMPLAPLLERIWELRDNVTPYDAAYVALAEALSGPLITCDVKLTRASGVRCTFDLIA